MVVTTVSRVESGRRASSAVAALATWAVLLAIGHAVVRWLPVSSKGLHVKAAPLVGGVDWRPNPRLLLAIAVAAAVVVAGPPLAARLTWRRLLLVTTVTALVWPVALALLDGGHALARPVASSDDYLAAAASVQAPGAFLDGFVDRIATYPVHVQGHPPGLVLALASLDRAGIGGTGAATMLYLSGGAAAAPAVLVAARDVAGEASARRAAPFVVLAPAALWMATSADALFAGVGAWAVALVVLATGRPGRAGDRLAVGGGVLLGVAAYLSYGLVLLLVIPLAVASYRRRLRPLVAAAVPVAAIACGFLVGGFWWGDGLLATRERYFTGIGGARPYSAFVVANLACLAIALGPALAVALARLRDSRVWLLAGGAVGAVVLADLSGLSKGEVERIWLPFVPWILVAGGALAAGTWRRGHGARGWLGLQAATALTLQTLVHTPW